MKTTKSSGKQKIFYDAVYLEDHVSNYGGDPSSLVWIKRVSELSEKTSRWLANAGLIDKPNAKILEVGCGLAYLRNIHPGWYGLDYSNSAVERVRALYGSHVRVFQGDSQDIPFSNNFFDGVFSWAALEHVPDPDKAFREMDRVCKPGGYLMIAPAWNCRSWTVEKLQNRPYASLNIAEKIQKFLIPLREHIVFRALAALPKRLFDEVRSLRGNPVSLRFAELSPRWDLIELYGHVADDDAVADIDPHSAILFFKSYGYEVLSHSNFLSRLSARHEPVIVRKSC